MVMDEITEDQFAAYVEVQHSGVTNMFDVKTVETLSGLNRSEIMTIMSNYSGLSKKYPINYE